MNKEKIKREARNWKMSKEELEETAYKIRKNKELMEEINRQDYESFSRHVNDFCESVAEHNDFFSCEDEEKEEEKNWMNEVHTE